MRFRGQATVIAATKTRNSRHSLRLARAGTADFQSDASAMASGRRTGRRRADEAWACGCAKRAVTTGWGADAFMSGAKF